MTLRNQPNSCSLCGLRTSSSFCCVGCETVYQILASRSELEGFREHPLFLEAAKNGLISNPALLEQMALNQPDLPEGEIEKVHFEIQNMWCPSCAELIKLVISGVKGVKRCVVDYSTDLATVEFSPRYLSKEQVFERIHQLGYQTTCFDEKGSAAFSFDWYLRFIIAAFFSANIMMLSYPVYASFFSIDVQNSSQLFAWLSFIASLPVLFYSAWPIFNRFFFSLSFGFMGMETLVVIGVSSAFSLSVYELLKGGKHIYFDSMSLIITFVLLGKIIESKAKFSVKETLLRLSKAIPKRGRKRFEDGTESFVLLKEVSKGDQLVALAGEKVVLDGVVLEGEGCCDESLMTGEAIPIRKKEEERVLAGSIVTQGRLVYRVEALQDQTALYQIVTTIESDLDRKTEYSRVIDPFLKRFVPLILAIALGSACGLLLSGKPPQEAILRAISILLISCPCALGIAAPLAESQTLYGMTKLGVIIRNRGCLASLGNEDCFVFDKTGTITEGKFQVLSGLEDLSNDEKGILKGLVCASNHPISYAINQKLMNSPVKFEKFEEIIGRGLQAFVEGQWYRLGSDIFLRKFGLATPKNTQNCTEVFFSKGSHLVSTIRLGDQVKTEAKKMIEALKPTPTLLLSGDAEGSVSTVAHICGMTEWRARVNPLEKRAIIDDIRNQGKIVAMLGDGINDAPALTAANIGLSVMTATDISVQVSDILLTTDRLSVIPELRKLAKKGQKVLKQNLFWAFAYNILGVGLAVFGYLNPLVSATAMVLSSLIVIFNAKRINPNSV